MEGGRTSGGRKWVTHGSNGRGVRGKGQGDVRVGKWSHTGLAAGRVWVQASSLVTLASPFLGRT